MITTHPLSSDRATTKIVIKAIPARIIPINFKVVVVS